MIKLSGIFSDHALFLHSSELTVRGVAQKESAVSLALTLNGRDVRSVSGTTDGTGRFALTFKTPLASFDAYEMTVKCASESVTLKDILFGELWLASGQSNMAMENRTQAECDEMLRSLKGVHIRAYKSVEYLANAEYPCEPLEFYEGCWAASEIDEHLALWENLSATATAWAKHLFTFLKDLKRGDVPVGFADLSRGGASVRSFLIKDSCVKNKKIYRYFSTTDKLVTPENWNTRGEANYQQLSAQYNLLISHTAGVKYRGVLWYQGECDLVNEHLRRIYAEELFELRKSYKEVFASDGDTFPLIASQIYPCQYTEKSGECRIAYLNKAIADLSRKYPKEHIYFPVCDLKAAFEVANPNHPIHPTHKYVHGERMALICENACYGRRVKRAQTLAPRAEKVKIEDGKIYVTFGHVGTGLFVKGRKVKCLYVRSADGVYTPAESYVADERTLCVYHPFIKAPAHVAYAVSDFEHDANLFAGEFPVTPFATDMGKEYPLLNVEIKNFTNMEVDSEVGDFEAHGTTHCYRQPVFYPADGTTLVFDSDFSRSGRSLRLHGEGERFGAYVLSRKFHLLDMHNYSELRAWFLNTRGLSATLTFSYSDGRSYTVAAKHLKDERSGWGEYSFDLTGLVGTDISKMQFDFEISRENPLNMYVNIDCITLVPKK